MTVQQRYGIFALRYKNYRRFLFKETRSCCQCINYEDKPYGFNKVISSYGYLYNARGQRTYQIQEDGRITAYKYNPVGRINEAYYPFRDQKKVFDLKERHEYGLLPTCQEPRQYKFDFGHKYNWEEKENFQTQITEFLDNLMVIEEPEGNGKNKGKDNGKNEEFRINTDDRYIKTLDLSYADRTSLNKLYQNTRKGQGQINYWNLRFWSEEYEYDPNGNITTKRNGWGEINYQYNQSNQLLQAGKREYQYDLNGNRSKEIFGKYTKEYAYNQENRLVRIDNNFQPPIKDQIYTGQQVEYHYDALGRKVGKEITPFKGKAKDVHYYIYNGLGIDVLTEYHTSVEITGNNGRGNAYGHRNNDKFKNYWPWGPWSAGSQGESREYYYGNGMLLAAKDIEKGSKPGFGGWSRNPLEDVTFYHHDALGSVVLLTNDKGHVVESYQYDVYGNAYNGKFTSLGKNSGQGSIFGSGNGYGYGSGKSTNVYGFTGKRYEPEVGLYAFAFRDYNPQTMRWLTIDPIKDGLNWYQYCGGDPVNWVDLWGLWEKEIHSGSEEYGGTLQWAQDVGFTKGQAQIIAKASNYVDSPTSGKCPAPVIGDQRYHFNTNPDAEDGSPGDSRVIVAEEHLEKAIELQKKANESEGTFDAIIFEMDALTELGTGLHAIQDISAHTGDFVDGKLVGLDIPNHLGEKGKGADYPVDPSTGKLNERYYQALNDTKEYLQRFKEETECSK